jgi:hypothetical protein
MTIKFVNFFKSKIADVGGIGSGDTEFTLSAGDGADLPTLTGGHHCYLTFVDVSSNREIVKVTGVASDTCTIVRGQDGTTPRAFAQNDLVELRLTKGSLEDVQAQTIESTTVMLFGQASAPTGWTKKTDWADNSMIIYTTGTPGAGGSDSPKSWSTSVVAEAAHTHAGPSHIHSTGNHILTISEIPSHRHNIPPAHGNLASNSPVYITTGHTFYTTANLYTGYEGGGVAHNHGNTGAGGTANTGAGASHTHDLTDSDFTPKYQEVIAATRD